MVRTLMRALLPSLILLTTACESNESKYARLNQKLLVAKLTVDNEAWAEENHKPLCPEFVNLSTDAYVTACNRRVEDDRARLALAQREMNKFMEGR